MASNTFFLRMRSLITGGLIGVLALSAFGQSAATVARVDRAMAEQVMPEGKHQAFRGKLVPRRSAFERRPSNKPIRYKGPKLRLQSVNVGRRAAEPTLSVTKDGAAFYAAADFDGPTGNLAKTEILRSTDGGMTWENVSAEIPATGQDEPITTLDPYVWVDTDTSRVFDIDLYVGSSYLNYSDDNGDTWERNPAASGEFVNDHHTLSGGPPPQGIDTIDYPNVLYYCFNRVADSDCGHSLDGGRSFIPTATPAYLGAQEDGGFCGGLHGHVIVDNDGRVLLPKGHCGRPTLAVSEDAADTWTRHRVTRTPRTAGTHTAVAVDSEDNIYYLWWSRKRRLPYLSISKDHGETWSLPRMVAPPGVREVNFPTLDAGDKGRVVIMFPGTTSNDHEDTFRPWNSYFVMSTNALSKNPLFISRTANPINDPIHRGNCGPGRCGGMLDFLDVIVSPHDGDFWGAISDTCVGVCALGPAPPPNSVGDGFAVRQVGGPRLVKP